ncbi:MAG: SLC13 family permease [Acidobacteria bacterium]|nr:SLC13 family permease [Acidobacteriota bacterium]NIM64217.1 SLC13 family permease [Acidobacteriota bacterium]NIO59215.1 SLC13 family permease [Acidobacteriota bacterium]NIQ30242.1 SLC13 family permease [Acidobacteriota bacterium]NIQ85170.1 SLC13 family permease [Acidobacteriota bacterium]
MDEILLVVILIGAVVLLATERLRADVVAMVVLCALVLLRILEPRQALSGFSNPATITVACMFILSAGLQASGVIHALADRLLKGSSASPTTVMLMTGVAIAPFSAFINNTAAVAIFLPLVLRASHSRSISPSYLMMPLSFFAMLGGTCTLIGTSTNIIVSSAAAEHGQPGFGMFEFSKLGLIVLLICGAYLMLIGRHILPERIKAETLTEGFHLNSYLSEVEVLDGSPLIGQTVVEARIGDAYNLEVLGHVRDKQMRNVMAGHGALLAGDILLVKAQAETLVGLGERAGLAVRPSRRHSDSDLRPGDTVLLEAVITNNSELEGRSLKAVDFRNNFGATALAIRRGGEDLLEKIGHVRLRLGDELLIQAPRQNLEKLRNQRAFLILQELDLPTLDVRKAVLSGSIIAGVVAVAAFGIYPIVSAAIAGAVLMVVTGCLNVRRVYREVDWVVIVLLGGLIPLGIALETTGAAADVADLILRLGGQMGPHVALGLFVLLTAVLTGAMSNNATAALLAPLAIQIAVVLDVDPRPFLVALTFAASAAFYTPIGYQTNLLVYGPGGYKFADYFRVGAPLTVLYVVLVTWLIPMFFPF